MDNITNTQTHTYVNCVEFIIISQVEGYKNHRASSPLTGLCSRRIFSIAFRRTESFVCVNRMLTSAGSNSGDRPCKYTYT